MIIIREKAQGKRKYYERVVSGKDTSVAAVQTVEYRLVKDLQEDRYPFYVLIRI